MAPDAPGAWCSYANNSQNTSSVNARILDFKVYLQTDCCSSSCLPAVWLHCDLMQTLGLMMVAFSFKDERRDHERVYIAVTDSCFCTNEITLIIIMTPGGTVEGNLKQRRGYTSGIFITCVWSALHVLSLHCCFLPIIWLLARFLEHEFIALSRHAVSYT